MGRRYVATGKDTNTASTSILGVTSAATVRPKIYDLIWGSDATPADNAAEYFLQRYTVAGTSTSVTPLALDPGDPAALASAGKAHTVEPTYTANALLLDWMQNQRATFRWVAAPGSELVLPATAANGAGIVVNAVAGSAVSMGGSIYWEE